MVLDQDIPLLVFSTEEDKWRGPFTNNGDQCWHIHGSVDIWEVNPVPFFSTTI
ncbi:7766_t:CDS:2 [Funneliformis geosporum]|uniref:7766_t:CDS:1 n=1 Tax=Funneliformis geosporum TaxID=1117311 RepID=A0A9W4WSF5_9GLOM|nr:7766_t:CDS:2 [Funneliformis geosporum]